MVTQMFCQIGIIQLTLDPPHYGLVKGLSTQDCVAKDYSDKFILLVFWEVGLATLVYVSGKTTPNLNHQTVPMSSFE